MNCSGKKIIMLSSLFLKVILIRFTRGDVIMLIDKIQSTHFSPSEKEVIQYVLNHTDQLDDLSTQTIAEATYTSAPIVIRVAKKLGLKGWNELKLKLKSEIAYLYAINEVDASVPFVITNNYTDIANHLETLEKETIKDTLSLLTHDLLYKAMSLLRNKKEIDIYCSGPYYPLALLFQSQLETIDYHVKVCKIGDNDRLNVAKANKEHIALLMPVENHKKETLSLIKKLKAKHIPMIGIIPVEGDYLTDLIDCTLLISSRELANVRIGEFASTTGAKYLLDTLYGCIFSMHYEENLNQRISLLSELNC